jgi:osmotically inducible protein OsmC
MAVTSTGSATWRGSLTEGAGTARLATSGLGAFDIAWQARSEGSDGTTTPEELLGAAHAACFSMALSHRLGQRGYTAESIETSSAVTFQAGEGITGIVLSVAASVPGISPEEFEAIAEEVKTSCPVSAALAAVPMSLSSATLKA